ncbi:MAG: TIGR04283 family arsenosugar biosynthesis glycosyltransferase [Oscillospiraceae bacterium]|nr:TIGR04283 family arsenosugar biosynthesis glycosyltransferase [Oscillospiraceae bacterium]
MTNLSQNAKVSIIIPLYNESKCVGTLLEHLLVYEDTCEIIFVDAGSTDDTAMKVESWIAQKTKFSSSIRCLYAPEKGRANQMNYGAKYAKGDILWFLHADSIPPADAPEQIMDIIDKGHSAGCFHVRFDSNHPLMLYNSFMSNLRVSIRKIAFGDQGIFVRKTLFEDLGGYAPIPLMEDYKLSLDIRNSGFSLPLLKGTISTSDRRYLVGGRLRTMIWMLTLQRRYIRGEDIYTLAEEYAQGPPGRRA